MAAPGPLSAVPAALPWPRSPWTPPPLDGAAPWRAGRILQESCRGLRFGCRERQGAPRARCGIPPESREFTGEPARLARSRLGGFEVNVCSALHLRGKSPSSGAGPCPDHLLAEREVAQLQPSSSKSPNCALRLWLSHPSSFVSNSNDPKMNAGITSGFLAVPSRVA